ncbi:sensor histidine kinase [Butyrivibrio sp. M55]|uniref:sensor histidine kinase n=1 Tax=Butyrivibrio sp. M55 TaxID=1855323 RepID=UPI0008E884EC|nr:HAMP domain-containing sensor histidine kinase [Butyrivibrio sp. M55]SFU59664.1 Signal transduction histidine kinase [Butyrivibrio sp. M55]
MLKRMRYRVIIAAMAAFLAVILMVAFLVNLINYTVVTKRLDETIYYIQEFEAGNPQMPPGMIPGQPGPEGNPPSPDGTPPGPPPDGPFQNSPDAEAGYMTRFFIARLDSSGIVMSTSLDFVASVDASGAKQLAEQVYSGKKERGYIKEFRFGKAKLGDSTVIVFLNSMRELQFMHTLRSLTIAVSIVSLLLVFILVVLFSNRAIRPIAKNISRQKQFITDASHELKTPLTSISTSLDVLSMEHENDEWIDNIRKQTGRMSKLVSELVQLSRLDEDIPLPDKEHFSLSSAAWEIFEVFEVQAKASEKNFSADIQDNVNIYGDKSAIHQMLSVLIDNAIRYSDENAEIRLSVYKKKNKAIIEVFNTCELSAIPDTDKLFDRFYRPDSSRSTETGGTGVGLAIAKAAAEAHGGTISAECPSGKTMTIKVII